MVELNWNIIWEILNILVLFIFFKMFLFKPVLAILEKRKNSIENSLQEAENTKTDALLLKSNYEAQISHAKEDADLIIKESRERAMEEYNRQIRDTKEEASRILQDANKAIELEKRKSIQDAQAEIASVAMLAAAKVIQQNVDENTNKRFLNDFLNEVGATK